MMLDAGGPAFEGCFQTIIYYAIGGLENKVAPFVFVAPLK